MQRILIRQISIKGSPVFKAESFSPNEHFNVFSGVSGAGKSTLLESILALFGLRECNALNLEAILELDGIAEEFRGLIDDGEMTLTLSKKDKVRYFLNAQNIPKKKVQELFAPFLKHLSVKSYDATSEKNLFFTLDSFIAAQDSQHLKILGEFQESFMKFQSAKEELQKLEGESLRVADLKEFVSFEIQKIESLKPRKGEYEELLALKKDISRKEKISASLQEARDFLSQSHKIFNFLHYIDKDKDFIVSALNELESLCEIENERLQSLEGVNPEGILSRIEELSALNKRYGGIDEALEFLESKKKELRKYENLDEILREAKNNYQNKKESLKQCAITLTNARLKQLESFENALNNALLSLKMPKSKVFLQTLDDVESYTQDGAQRIEIMLNTSLKNLSAGEFNRFVLALLLTQSSRIKHQAIIILDEVDANLSGEESQGVAAALKALSKHYQVFAISHQPHMPTLADSHFLVKKESQESHIIPLDKDGRIQEIARMISGEVITKEAIEFATRQLSTL